MGISISKYITNLFYQKSNSKISEVSSRRDILAVPWDYEYKLNNGLTLKGHSRSGERTCFFIPELSTYLDAGLQGTSPPHLILLTHGHCDHSHALPMMNINNNNSTILYVLNKTAKYTDDYITSLHQLNKGGQYYGQSGLETRPVEYNQQYPVTIKKRNYQIETFKCYHSVPCVGYGITEIRQKLKEEYSELTGKEIGKLRREGIEINCNKQYPLIAYIGDTTIKVLEDINNKNVFNYPYIIIESTFILPDQIDLAIKNKHIHWQQLIPYVVNHPEITFILIHFSPRYRDQEIIDFFENEKKKLNITNIKAWVN
jgi:ribonuclease Z